MKPQQPFPKWHERASRSEINEVAAIDRSIAEGGRPIRLPLE